MRFPFGFTLAQARYQAVMKKQGRKRYPTVLMLEPLYTCNLACRGCSTERHTGKLAERLSLEQCLKAVDDSGVPIVSICGGEPTLYPELPELVSTLIERDKYLILCTNSLLMQTKVFETIPPDRHLFINVHLDGMRDTHDFVCNRPGVWDHAIDMIKQSKQRGYQTWTNTTIFKESRIEEFEELCDLLTSLKVDGILVSPGYQYESVDEDVFLNLEQTHQKFRRVLEVSHKYRLTSTPPFLEFAAGLRELDCSPYSTVNYSPLGWKAPCYLLDEKYYQDFQTFWKEVDWARWESRQDPRCANCKMHSGFEHSAVQMAMGNVKDMLKMAAWQLTG